MFSYQIHADQVTFHKSNSGITPVFYTNYIFILLLQLIAFIALFLLPAFHLHVLRSRCTSFLLAPYTSMKRLQQWMNSRQAGHRHNGGKKSNKNRDVIENTVSTMPKLPSSRPRAITMSHSDISQERSQFFTMLPGELRENVYLYLFGHRTIHIDLQYDHADRIGAQHANLAGPFCKDMSTPKQWRWWSCMCHRIQKEVHGELFVLDFWLDNCRSGEQTYCKWAFPDRSECFVGALGWLSSCRQA